LRRVLPRGRNSLFPEKPGAAGVAAPSLDKKKKMVFGLSYQLDFLAPAVIIFATKLILESSA